MSFYLWGQMGDLKENEPKLFSSGEPMYSDKINYILYQNSYFYKTLYEQFLTNRFTKNSVVKNNEEGNDLEGQLIESNGSFYIFQSNEKKKFEAFFPNYIKTQIFTQTENNIKLLNKRKNSPIAILLFGGGGCGGMAEDPTTTSSNVKGGGGGGGGYLTYHFIPGDIADNIQHINLTIGKGGKVEKDASPNGESSILTYYYNNDQSTTIQANGGEGQIATSIRGGSGGSGGGGKATSSLGLDTDEDCGSGGNATYGGGGGSGGSIKASVKYSSGNSTGYLMEAKTNKIWIAGGGGGAGNVNEPSGSSTLNQEGLKEQTGGLYGQPGKALNLTAYQSSENFLNQIFIPISSKIEGSIEKKTNTALASNGGGGGGNGYGSMGGVGGKENKEYDNKRGGGGGGGGFGKNAKGGNGGNVYFDTTLLIPYHGAGGGGGGWGAAGGDALYYLGGGGGGYGPNGKGGSATLEDISSLKDGGIAAGGAGYCFNSTPSKGGDGVCIIYYYT